MPSNDKCYIVLLATRVNYFVILNHQKNGYLSPANNGGWVLYVVDGFLNLFVCSLRQDWQMRHTLLIEQTLILPGGSTPRTPGFDLFRFTRFCCWERTN